MPEIAGLEDWQQARLIPVAGIRGQEEQEVRATSAFLAVLSAVPEFSHALLAELGAPRGYVQAFTEVRLKDPDGKIARPDGAIVATRGSRTWTALIEVKTRAAALTTEQTSQYLDLARDHGFDAVLTISNQITGRSQDDPCGLVPVDKALFARDELVGVLGRARAARCLGISYQCLWAWLSGRRKNMHKEMATRVLRLLWELRNDARVGAERPLSP